MNNSPVMGLLLGLAAFACIYYFAFGTHQKQPPVTEIYTRDASSYAIPSVLRIKPIDKLVSLVITLSNGRELLNVKHLSEGESTYEVNLPIVANNLELIVTAEFVEKKLDRTIFVTVEPESMSAQTRFVIGAGNANTVLRFNW